ncbi:MAG: glycosyl hydrolase 2 galactose-binding domain-containing protein, partial [Phycisphaerales bacterium]
MADPSPAPIDLSSFRWRLRAVAGPLPPGLADRALPATIPGCVHTDLFAAGLIPDPATIADDRALEWISLADWQYDCDFDAGPSVALAATLHCESLDTLAHIELNTVPVAHSHSEFIPCTIPVGHALRPGLNHLRITFRAPLAHIRRVAATAPPLPVNGDWDPYIYLRKCAANFGWDWGPRFATCGITGPITLHPRTHAPAPPPQPPAAPPLPVASARFDPRDGSFGFSDSRGPLFCRGVNWIPEGLFPRDRTRERVLHRLQQIRAANANMIRLWGGGRYEPDWFYHACTDLGLMVWQDFAFTCAGYPEDPAYAALVEQEARAQVTRLSRHPCVVLYCGGNECTWAHDSWGFKERLAPGQPYGHHYYHTLLPRIVRDLDPARFYWPNSPYPGTPGPLVPPALANDATRGDRHTWDLPIDGWRTITPRFCSEFGHQSPPTLATILETFGEPGARLDAPWLSARQRGPGGNQRWYTEPFTRLNLADGPMIAERAHAAHTADPRARFIEWLTRAHAVQAFALYDAITHLRSSQPTCRGALLWQANDAWPGHSWSIIDSAGREKTAYAAVRHAIAPRLLTLQPTPSGLEAIAINDTDTPWATTATITLPGAPPLRLPLCIPPRALQRTPINA